MPSFDLVQFDSYGAKSSCTKVVTPDVKIVIDPGVAVMHPSFPADKSEKLRWAEEGKERVYNALKDAEMIIITHYHHDHYLRDPSVYKNKLLFLKNPNVYINKSQRKRAAEFLKNLADFLGVILPPVNAKMELRDIELRSLYLDFSDYNSRRRELLEKGKEWFWRVAESWMDSKHIGEISDNITVKYPEGSCYTFRDTVIRFTEPLFHGLEYSRTGWVYSVIIEYHGWKLLYSSDLNGPVVEDYADMIINENPDVIILDGPPTYMLGYILNRINLKRAVDNVLRIVDSVDYDVFIWDHHLPREKRFRERTGDVWNHPKGREILTAREYKYNRPPIIEEL